MLYCVFVPFCVELRTVTVPLLHKSFTTMTFVYKNDKHLIVNAILTVQGKISVLSQERKARRGHEKHSEDAPLAANQFSCTGCTDVTSLLFPKGFSLILYYYCKYHNQ